MVSVRDKCANNIQKAGKNSEIGLGFTFCEVWLDDHAEDVLKQCYDSTRNRARKKWILNGGLTIGTGKTCAKWVNGFL